MQVSGAMEMPHKSANMAASPFGSRCLSLATKENAPQSAGHFRLFTDQHLLD
jgi:hypothetical protein